MLGSTRPTSPTYSVTTNTTDVRDLTGRAERIITKADLKASAEAYEQLLNTSRFFRDALAGVSRASAKFAEAIEKCSRLKGPSDACGKDLQAAAGLHHLISNHEQILEHTIVHKFEIPLRQGFETYKASTAERTAEYERALTEKSRLIRKTEADNMRVGRKKLRDLNSFRAALASLQAQVNDLDKLKSDYYQQVLEHEQQIWDGVLGNVSVVVRSTMDVYDRITAKASDPSLEHILASVPDPFDEYASQAPASDAIFSILAPLEIMSGVRTPGETTAPGSASSSAGNSNSGRGLTSAPPSENGLNAWIDKQSEWTDTTRRYSLPLMGSSGSSSGTSGYPTPQAQHLPYAVAASSPLASPPLMGMVEEVRRDGSGGSRFGSREPSVERHEDAGGWASYALPPRSRVHSMERGPTLSQSSDLLFKGNGTSEALLDGATPTATRFPNSQTTSEQTVTKEGEKDDAASESGTTVVAAGTEEDRKTIR
ncbi:Protein IVY1 AltName: Full=Interaction with VPS33 and YPT7 protein 1 [Rhizoctonia solani AG-1 IB]|uniref:IVY1 protein n=1 Tax=Thanatephorus cucumeris (strain AG1-IB / isolate 7/3/14) TaxID=1108050 RepID=M5BU81_THACB|nr:Protein IVY1 AltName: Full=Interaction with VPS33 and YPT7 protein 1 [Rhizoctonia solani AG-1 IB]